MLRLLDPFFLLSSAYLIAIVLSNWVSRDVLEATWGDARVITAPTLLWIALCLFSFGVGQFIERTPRLASRRGDRIKGKWKSALSDAPKQIERALPLAWVILAVSGSITVWWFMLGASQVGGLREGIRWLLSDPTYFKEGVILQIARIGHITIWSVAATGITVFALTAKFVCWGWLPADSLPVGLKRRVNRLLLASLVILILRSFLLTERLILWEGIGSGLIAGFIAFDRLKKRARAGQGVGIGSIARLPKFRVLALGVLAVSMSTLIIYLRTPAKLGGWQGIGKNFTDSLLFYFAANIRNLDSAVTLVEGHTYGFFTFSFLLKPFRLHRLIPSLGLLSTNLSEHISAFGTTPILADVWLDFGAFGALILFVLGLICSRLYSRALSSRSILAIELYSTVAAALILAWFVFIPRNPRFWVNVLVFVVLNWWGSRQRSLRLRWGTKTLVLLRGATD